jgi:hypothetical protein
MIMNGIRIYIVTIELIAEEMVSPIILARQDVLNNTIQYVRVMPLMPRIKLPIRMKDMVWMAEIMNIRSILEFR